MSPAAGARSTWGGRSSVGARFMVTAPHADAARVGAAILADGGSAADAAIGVAAALAVLYPHMTGIGGDAFWLYHDAASGRLHAYNGSGAAAGLATLQYYAERGCAAVPVHGPLAALTVPGAVDAWFALHGRFGRIGIERVLAPAIAYARDGAPAAPSVVRSLVEERPVLERDEPSRQIFLKEPPPGESRLVQPALARTLENIAAHGRDWFYQGEAAERVSAWAAESGSPLRADDFAEHRGVAVDPLAAPFAGLQSCTVPPNSQGITLLIAQRILDARFREAYPARDGAELIDAAIGAIRIAYAQRDRFVGDPRFTRAPIAQLLSDERAHAGAAASSSGQIAESMVTAEGDTTYFACVDVDGNSASYIQSLYMHFGAAVTVAALGMTLQNRGIAFTLDAGGERSLVPGKRPFHTLMPAMLVRDGSPAIVYGSMGGDAQPQITLQLSIRMARFGDDPQQAISAPRWRWESGGAPQRKRQSGRLALESRTEAAVATRLTELGHDVVLVGEWEQSMGHAGAIVIDRKAGSFFGAADPRGDGAAIGE